MESESEKIKEITQKFAEEFSKKISEAVENRIFIRRVLDKQIEKLPEKEQEKIKNELGDFASTLDTEKILDNFLENNLSTLANEYYQMLSVDDSRLHNALWLLGDETAEVLHEDIKNQNAAGLNELLSKFMFAFEDIARLPDRDIEKLIRMTSEYHLRQALSIASKETIDAFMRNMSERMAERIEKEKEYYKPVERKDALESQRVILRYLEEFIDSGEIEVPYYAMNSEKNYKGNAYLRDDRAL